MPMPLVTVHGPDDVRLDRVEIPEAETDDVIIKVSLCGICGSDLGYNAIGNGGPEGGFAPFLKVRGAATDRNALLKVPASLRDEHAALVEPLSVALHGCHQGQAKPGDRVVIFGAGPIGLSAVVALRHLGISDIVVVDLSTFRLSIAQQLGATPLNAASDNLAQTLMELHGNADLMGMALPATDLYLETSGARQAFEQIVSLGKTGARVAVLGLHKEPVALDLVNLLMRELMITGSMAYHNEFDEVISMLSSARIDVSPLISHRFPLSKFSDALTTARQTSHAAKVLIDCQQ